MKTFILQLNSSTSLVLRLCRSGNARSRLQIEATGGLTSDEKEQALTWARGVGSHLFSSSPERQPYLRS